MGKVGRSTFEPMMRTRVTISFDLYRNLECMKVPTSEEEENKGVEF